MLVAPPVRTARSPEEHLGIAYLAAEAERDGHMAVISDCWLGRVSVESLVSRVFAQHFGVVGISPSMNSSEPTCQMVHELRKNGFGGMIALGGHHATFGFRDYFSTLGKGLDAVFRGEADNSFPDFLNHLARGEDWTGLRGLAYWRNDYITVNPPARRVDNLDALPFPKRDTIEHAIKSRMPAHVCDSRDCYNRCSFCSIGAFYDLAGDHRRWRGRSPESIAAELEQLQGLGVTVVKFLGDSFFGPTGWRERALDLCSEIARRNIRLRFRISTRVNNVDKEVFQSLRDSGLFAVSLGVESGVQRKLDDYSKNATVAQNLRATRILRELGIYVQMGFILFDPWVTLEELAREYDFLKQENWSVLKGLDTSLYAAEGTPISARIGESCGFVCREGVNYKYEINDKRVRDVRDALRQWGVNSAGLYASAVDPISAPRVVSPQMLRRFHRVSCRLKEVDMEVFGGLLKLATQGATSAHLREFVCEQIVRRRDFHDGMKAALVRMYVAAHLTLQDCLQT